MVKGSSRLFFEFWRDFLFKDNTHILLETFKSKLILLVLLLSLRAQSFDAFCLFAFSGCGLPVLLFTSDWIKLCSFMQDQLFFRHKSLHCFWIKIKIKHIFILIHLCGYIEYLINYLLSAEMQKLCLF